MRLCLIFSMVVLASCGRDSTTFVRTHVPADLLQPEPGWTGPRPQSEVDFALAAEAEKAGRKRANAKLEAVSEILGSE